MNIIEFTQFIKTVNLSNYDSELDKTKIMAEIRNLMVACLVLSESWIKSTSHNTNYKEKFTLVMNQISMAEQSMVQIESEFNLLNNKNQQLIKLKARYDEYIKEIEKINELSKTISLEKVNDLQSKNEKLKENFSIINAQHQKLQEEYNDLTQKLNSKEKELTIIKTKIKELNQQQEKYSAEFNRVSLTKSEREKELDMIKSNISEINQNLEQTENAINEYRVKVSDIIDNFNKLDHLSHEGIEKYSDTYKGNSDLSKIMLSIIGYRKEIESYRDSIMEINDKHENKMIELIEFRKKFVDALHKQLK